MKRLLTGIPLLLIFSLTGISAAHAHKVAIFAWVEGDTVHTESKFSGGKMVKGGKVEVFDEAGTLLLEGRTNDNGEFSFKIPKSTDLNIVLSAGMGHKNSWKLSADELGTVRAAATDALAAAPEKATVHPPGDALSHPTAAVISVRQLEEIVARQLEKQLQPLNRMLATSRDEGVRISDIIGGIGYILGLVGLGVYIRYRKTGRK